MIHWYVYVGLMVLVGVFAIIEKFVFRRPLFSITKKSRRDKIMLEHLVAGKGTFYLRTYGCHLCDPTSKTIITEYIFTEHSPKPCGIFFAHEIIKEAAEIQQEALRILVEKLKKMPFKYRTKFIGGAKTGKLEYGGKKAKEIGKTLAKMLDLAMPDWRIRN